ncbi:MAG TPA: phosphopantothenoylcysteine decarboxylase [Thermoguttaceae bacterium]|nr:phosphopantothenoylcysteine decarboxylase [Thermoguttaceae bacterium]
MARILITSGPTRQYLDPVRYLTNASSGRMGAALASAALNAGHEVVVVSGPVDVEYPPQARIIPVVSTEEMLEACLDVFPDCDGLIGVAAPCDYRPVVVSPQKIRKTGEPLQLHLVETPDVVALLGAVKQSQRMVAFALETEDLRMRALQKLERKSCDLIVVNGPDAMHARDADVEVINVEGKVLVSASGSKQRVAEEIFQVIQQQLVENHGSGQTGPRSGAHR